MVHSFFCFFTFSDATVESAMDAVDRMTLQKNWTYLLDHLDSEDVIPYLVQELILDFDMVEEIEAAETKKVKLGWLIWDDSA